MYFTGGTIIFDHGHGISSTIYAYERYKCRSWTKDKARVKLLEL